jgi:hypothetical protein
VHSLPGTKGSLWVETVFGDPESTAIAVSILNCFGEARWTLSTAAQGVGPTALPINLTVSGENKEKASTVRSAFSGVLSTPIGDDDTAIERSILNRFSENARGPKEVRIIVGSRPIFDQEK